MTLEQWLSHIQTVHFRSIDLELDRIRTVLERLLPKGPRFQSISVAGTNGKGTAVEALSCVLMQTGRRIGSYTSPHLVRYTERVRVDGIEATESELCAAFDSIESARGDVPLTYFEFGTLAAFLVFERRGVELAVLEVGMGGRLDAVNSVDAIAALVTSIAIDHEQWLGSDRETIAVEKSGIFRPNRPAVCADPDPPATLIRCAQRVGAKLYLRGADFDIRQSGDGWVWTGPRDRIELPGLRMRAFQAGSVAGALMVLKCLDDLVPVGGAEILAGLSSMRLRGRCEVIPGRPRIVLDVAHNVAALQVLVDFLRTENRGGRTLAVCGMLRDKPIGAMARLLDPIVDEWFAGAIDDSRGCSAAELGDRIDDASEKPLSRHGSVLSAFRAAVNAARPVDRIVVFGSFHTVGDIIRALEGEGAGH